MFLSLIFTWLQSAPLFTDKTIHLDFLPSRGGWSMSMPACESKRDILGTEYAMVTVKVTCRATVMEDSDRQGVYDSLSSLADWARRNPPAGFVLKSHPSAQFVSRDPSGMEDLSVTLTLTEY